MSHTSGGWEQYEDNTVQRVGCSGGSRDCVAVVYGCGDGDEDSNARLIAAAPDLLEACKAALPALSAHEQTGCDCPDSEAARMLRAAINKALGA